MDNETLLTLTADIVSAHVNNNTVPAEDLPGVIAAVFGALSQAGEPVVVQEVAQAEPAVSIRSSVRPDAITCLECGKKLKMLKRHLSTDHQMTPQDYRSRWGLKSDYPIVAPDYAAKRQELAKKIGLGRKPAAKVAAAKSSASPAAKSAAKPKTPAKQRQLRQKLKLNLES